MKKLQSLNSEEFAPMPAESMIQLKGGETATGDGTVTYQGKDYKFATDCTDWINGRYNFKAYDNTGKLVLDYWG